MYVFFQYKIHFCQTYLTNKNCFSSSVFIVEKIYFLCNSINFKKSMRIIEIADKPQNCHDLKNIIRMEKDNITPEIVYNVQEECHRPFN